MKSSLTESFRVACEASQFHFTHTSLQFQLHFRESLIPDDMEFQSGDMPNYTTSDGSVKIQKDSEVQLKIIGTRVDATEIKFLFI
ncbi:hypothetical protein TSUD_219100 [Trifolium subterraneum]|uniref:Uncharacterized protein n=1 Tax=Trifolium subterraneum TaxID=3900 RepID=A0A2Z6P370_TRISU|nr:hypothetical protein TSUD_219100 [Trifolium subterraneum]